MFLINMVLVLFLLTFRVSICDRRITGGRAPTKPKPYAVYIYRGSFSTKLYNNWICGGALVTREYIVTSASCVIDVEFMYVAAGYRKYITDDQVSKDNCLKNVAKKIVYFCTPKAFEMEYKTTLKWSSVDIAVAKVESPFNFADQNFKKHCSYNPTTIRINYENFLQRPGTDAFVVGWGHDKTWRLESDLKNYNQKELRYASCVIEEKKICKAAYSSIKGMGKVIDNYMLCTAAKLKGQLNDAGELFSTSAPTADGCGKYNNNKPNATALDLTRKDGHNDLNNVTGEDNTFNISEYYNQSRRNGFCQNDHGGPLVTWVGKHEVLIGVASVFLIKKNRDCVGPFLYTSTQCNGAFLDCALTGGKGTSRRFGVSCNDPPEKKGFDQVERRISWINHPDGPADNEREAVKLANENIKMTTEKISLHKLVLPEEEPTQNKTKISEKNKSLIYLEKSVATVELSPHEDNIKKQQKQLDKSNASNEKVPHERDTSMREDNLATGKYIKSKISLKPARNSSNEKQVARNKKSKHVNELGIYTATVKILAKEPALNKSKSLVEQFAERDVYTATVKFPVKQKEVKKNHPSIEKFLLGIQAATIKPLNHKLGIKKT